jgi:hypothetical protein
MEKKVKEKDSGHNVLSVGFETAAESSSPSRENIKFSPALE